MANLRENRGWQWCQLIQKCLQAFEVEQNSSKPSILGLVVDLTAYAKQRQRVSCGLHLNAHLTFAYNPLPESDLSGEEDKVVDSIVKLWGEVEQR